MAERIKMHWMISALLVAGAWLSALCFVGISYLIGGVSLDPLYFGGFFIIAAAVLALCLRRADLPAVWTAFLNQVELAFSLCGKALFCIGFILRWRLEPGGAFAVAAVMAAAGYPLFRQKADRAVSVCAALCMGIAWQVLTIPSFPSALLETFAVAAFAGAYILLLRNKQAGAPLAWALLGACAFASGIYLSETTFSLFWFNPPLLGAALCAVYARGVRGTANGWVMLGILLLCVLSNTGTVMGLALLVLGFVQKRLSLKIIGAGVMYASLIWLYYSMHATLLVKSYYLGAAGLLLLGAYVKFKKGETHAE